MRNTVKHQVTLSEWEECWGFVADTARDSTSEGKHQECSATQRETVFSQQREALKSTPNCREESPGRSEKSIA